MKRSAALAVCVLASVTLAAPTAIASTSPPSSSSFSAPLTSLPPAEGTGSGTAPTDAALFNCPDAPKGDARYEAFLLDGSAAIGLGPLCSKAQKAAPTKAAAKALACAANQVSDPYEATPPGATPPDSWDSSKLTAYCWNKALPGANLEAYSHSQAEQVTRVKTNKAKPGDLVFFFEDDAHHVGMLVNRNYMVEAGNSATGVVVSNWRKGWAKEHFSFIGRVTVK